MRIFSIATVVFLAGCATTGPTTATPRGGPRGLRASDHLDIAARQDEQARVRSSWPDTSMVAVGGPDTAGTPVVMPWFRSWDTGGEHARLAESHRGQAAALQADFEQACGNSAGNNVTTSPLKRFGVGVWPTASGAIVYLSANAGTPDELLAAMKCHRAFMMLAPSDMDDCPLDLLGLELDARGDSDGVTVSLTVADRALIPELQRRTALELESAHHPDPAHTR